MPQKKFNVPQWLMSQFSSTCMKFLPWIPYTLQHVAMPTDVSDRFLTQWPQQAGFNRTSPGWSSATQYGHWATLHGWCEVLPELIRVGRIEAGNPTSTNKSGIGYTCIPASWNIGIPLFGSVHHVTMEKKFKLKHNVERHPCLFGPGIKKAICGV